MAWRGEVEDGDGWGGLVASKSEQRDEARLAALERDAARYRWLRENGKPAAEGLVIRKPEHWDDAIDIAMKGANAPN